MTCLCECEVRGVSPTLLYLSRSKSCQLSFTDSPLSTVGWQYDGLFNSWLVGQNPYQQSITDNGGLIVDKVVLINKDPYDTHLTRTTPVWYPSPYMVKTVFLSTYFQCFYTIGGFDCFVLFFLFSKKNSTFLLEKKISCYSSSPSSPWIEPSVRHPWRHERENTYMLDWWR